MSVAYRMVDNGIMYFLPSSNPTPKRTKNHVEVVRRGRHMHGYMVVMQNHTSYSGRPGKHLRVVEREKHVTGRSSLY